MPSLKRIRSATPAPGPSSESQVDEVYNEGDCTIISSDNVRFRIPSFYVLAASGVIRDMHHPDTSKPLEIPMHDPEIERSAAIKSWLAAITSKPIRDLKTLVTDARNALFLSRKYDCPALISSTLYQLHNALDDLTDKSPAIPNEEDIILLGGIFEDHQLIAKAIRIIGNDEFDDEHSETPFPSLHELEDQHISNPSAWSLQEYRRMPVDCIWALCRAYSVSVGLNERAEKFLSLMKDIKEFDNPTPKTRKKQKLAYVS